MTNATNGDIAIRRNLFSAMGTSQLRLGDSGQSYAGIDISDNVFDPSAGLNCVINFTRSTNLNAFRFADNSYRRVDSAGEYFCYGSNRTGLSAWRNQLESSASSSDYRPQSGGRNVDSYAQFLGVGATIADFSEEARKQSSFNWRKQYSPQAVHNYIRSGY